LAAQHQSVRFKISIASNLENHGCLREVREALG
jgi:hypothetical protein